MHIMGHSMSWSILTFLGSCSQLKPSNFGTNVGLTMLLNINSGFYHNPNLFDVFQSRVLKIMGGQSIIFLESFSNLAKTILLNSDEFVEYAHNGPLNKSADFGIPGFIFQVKAAKFDTHEGLNMPFNISSGFYHIRNFLCIFSPVFQHCALQITVNALTSVILLGPFSNMARIFIVLKFKTDSIMGMMY